VYWAQEELLPIAIEAPADRKPGTGGWISANSVDTVLPRSDFEVSQPVCVKLRGPQTAAQQLAVKWLGRHWKRNRVSFFNFQFAAGAGD
jgi:hypothetical protein